MKKVSQIVYLFDDEKESLAIAAKALSTSKNQVSPSELAREIILEKLEKES